MCCVFCLITMPILPPESRVYFITIGSHRFVCLDVEFHDLIWQRWCLIVGRQNGIMFSEYSSTSEWPIDLFVKTKGVTCSGHFKPATHSVRASKAKEWISVWISNSMLFCVRMNRRIAQKASHFCSTWQRLEIQVLFVNVEMDGRQRCFKL